MSIKIIDTRQSFLDIYNFNNHELVIKCAKDSEPYLKENPEITVYGKKCFQHRTVGFFSNVSKGYTYSNKLMESSPLTENLNTLLQEINNLFKGDFNGILVNKYKNGNDYISAHSDNEKELSRIGVVSLSLGETRKFRIRDKKTKKIVKDINISSFQIMNMYGDFQKEFLHEIPIEKKKTNSRYSFTFRKHLI